MNPAITPAIALAAFGSLPERMKRDLNAFVESRGLEVFYCSVLASAEARKHFAAMVAEGLRFGRANPVIVEQYLAGVYATISTGMRRGPIITDG